MYIEETARLALYAPGEFGKGSSKTAEGVLRYGKNPITCIIDQSQVGKSIKSVTGIDAEAPIVGSVEEALALGTDALLLGTAWNGGAMPDHWRQDIVKALAGGLDVINGLHDFLEDDANIVAAAKKHGKRLFDVRKPPENLPVAAGRVLENGKYKGNDSLVALTVGSDCSVGKMTVALEIQRSANKKGKEAAFVATGQTGIMICGRGIAIDRVIGDFMAGATEMMVLEAAQEAPVVLVEGQGSLAHPGFSGVTMALVHGSCPQAMIMCHRPSRTHIKGTNFAISDLNRLIATYELMAAYMRPSKVIAVALNTSDLSESEAQAAIAEVGAETKLPTTDPVRFSADLLWQAIEDFSLTPSIH
ncbi:MAG: DUF1611 domain-containing protein [Candidatus Melainabacteria bacterium]|nr:DUF1611 domain-containing protein [Candidatus Melainabacteria bacterium]